METDYKSLTRANNPAAYNTKYFLPTHDVKHQLPLLGNDDTFFEESNSNMGASEEPYRFRV